MAKALVELLKEKPVFVNLGVRGFAESLRSAGFEVVPVRRGKRGSVAIETGQTCYHVQRAQCPVRLSGVNSRL